MSKKICVLGIFNAIVVSVIGGGILGKGIRMFILSHTNAKGNKNFGKLDTSKCTAGEKNEIGLIILAGAVVSYFIGSVIAKFIYTKTEKAMDEMHNKQQTPADTFNMRMHGK